MEGGSCPSPGPHLPPGPAPVSKIRTISTQKSIRTAVTSIVRTDGAVIRGNSARTIGLEDPIIVPHYVEGITKVPLLGETNLDQRYPPLTQHEGWEVRAHMVHIGHLKGRWHCNDKDCINKDFWCWENPSEPAKHYNLTDTQLDKWANAIATDAATLLAPPESLKKCIERHNPSPDKVISSQQSPPATCSERGLSILTLNTGRHNPSPKEIISIPPHSLDFSAATSINISVEEEQELEEEQGLGPSFKPICFHSIAPNQQSRQREQPFKLGDAFLRSPASSLSTVASNSSETPHEISPFPISSLGPRHDEEGEQGQVQNRKMRNNVQQQPSPQPIHNQRDQSRITAPFSCSVLGTESGIRQITPELRGDNGSSLSNPEWIPEGDHNREKLGLADQLILEEEQIIQLNPRLTPTLLRRFANVQIYRYTRLLNMKQGECAGRISSAQAGQVKFLAGNPHPTLPTSIFPVEFKCPICFHVRWFQWPSDWARHIYNHIEPYTCTFEDCSYGSFKRKTDWLRHENEQHRQLEWWECSECGSKCYRKANFVKHLIQHHVPDPKSKRRRNVRGRRKNNEQEMNQVFELVENGHHLTTNTPQEEPCRFCGIVCTEWQELFDHLAAHMEQISFSILNHPELMSFHNITRTENGEEDPRFSPGSDTREATSE
ncbi:hypothetical protein BJX63DRAFT_24936 [Aspergillus granulosus]|uniref:C2H2-type domain-containing protein n=1 Tax=Aspergillus granulosus TaxID=176169 RepID=A0ABR4GZQ1_9EURO